MFRTWIILRWFLHKGESRGSSSNLQFPQCCLQCVFLKPLLRISLSLGCLLCPIGPRVCLQTWAVMLGYNGSVICLEIRYCDAPDLLFFSLLGVFDVLFNIKFRIFSNSVKNIFDVSIEIALSLQIT